MKIAPVSADLLIKLAIAAAVIGVGIYAVRRASAGISATVAELADLPSQIADYSIEGVKAAADRVWSGPADSVVAYDRALAATKADTDLNPFTNNPNNVNPADLVPSGYRVNQWGGLEPINVGVTGSW